MKLLNLILFFLMVQILSVQQVSSQTVCQFPETGTAIIKVKIPNDWYVRFLNDPGRPANDHGEIAIAPKDAGSTGPYISITRAAIDPDAPDATESIVNSTKNFISELLTDVKWKEKPQTFTSSKGLTFLSNSGTGFFTLNNGTKEPRVFTLYYFSPDDREELTMVILTTQASMDKYSSTMTQIINSIEPGK
jgi:hypothetical protein